jgi:hypothetical protein
MIPPLQQHPRRYPALVLALAAVVGRVAPVLVVVDMAFCFFLSSLVCCTSRGKSNSLALRTLLRLNWLRSRLH